jgi:hypothetical protein
MDAMDKWMVFTAVVLFGILRGLLQRRHVKAELDERMAKAKMRSLPRVRPLNGRLRTDRDDETVVAKSADPD